MKQMVVYGLTIFTGAFLLFQVQPLVGKYILPWFGGAPSIWTTCMLFFQIVLLAGYAYAHLAASTLKPRWPACSSTLLLATTSKMCQEVAVVPFLWIVPLGLYLLSFIICFDSPRAKLVTF